MNPLAVPAVLVHGHAPFTWGSSATEAAYHAVILEEVALMVVKSHGAREPFERSKIVSGVAAASKGRPVTAEQIEQLSIELEDHSRLQGNEITTAELGLEVLERLRSLDVVAYLRYASVYKNFDAAADFQRELVLLKKLEST